MPTPNADPSAQQNLAAYIDFENLALAFVNKRGMAFDIGRVLDRMLEKGKVVVKVAYADWGRFRKYTAPLHEAGVELIEIPKRSMTGKNSADIRLVVDALDLCYTNEHVNTFVIVSGDSDFSPLVSKLKANGKYVIGLSMRDSTSQLLANNCDEFIYYEDLEDPVVAERGGEGERGPKEKTTPAFQLLMAAVRALQRENQSVLYSSMVKDTMKRKQPSFSEAGYGFASFSELLEAAQEKGLLELRVDDRSGTYVISKVAKDPSRRRRRRSKAGG